MSGSARLTTLLNAAHNGDAAASDAAYRLVYAELRSCAQRQLRRARGEATLNPTALVNETYVRLAQNYDGSVKNRVHFFALCARAMRQIVVDHARRRHSAKRGGNIWHTSLEQALELTGDPADRAIELDAALRKLEERDPQLATLVEWHFFGGMSMEEIAAESGQTEHALRRDWELARAFLKCEMDSLPR